MALGVEPSSAQMAQAGLDSTSQDLLVDCIRSTELFLKVFMPERFTKPFSKILHKDLFAAMDDEKEEKIVVVAPRGSGKTSISLGFQMKRLLFLQSQVLIPVSSSAQNAVLFSENLKTEMVSNELVKKLFQPIQTKYTEAGLEASFSRVMWETSYGALVFPRGSGQQVRGILHKSHRPDLIVVDDLESDEEVLSEEQRLKTRRWFFSTLMGCRSMTETGWRVIVVGTLLHQDSLIARLMEDPNWTVIRLDISNDSDESQWPEFISTENLRKIKAQFESQDLMDDYNREYRGRPGAAENMSFKKEDFKSYIDTSKHGELTETVIIGDPAKTTNMRSAESAVIGIGINEHGMYVRDVYSGKIDPEEFYKQIVDMGERLGASMLALEVTSLHDYIEHPFLDYMHRRGSEPGGRSFQFQAINAVGKKEDRIAKLVPYYRRGIVYHSTRAAGKIEPQLLSFPHGRYVDVIDAFAHVIKLLNISKRFFRLSDKKSVDLTKPYSLGYQGLEEIYAQQAASLPPALSGRSVC